MVLHHRAIVEVLLIFSMFYINGSGAFRNSNCLQQLQLRQPGVPSTRITPPIVFVEGKNYSPVRLYANPRRIEFGDGLNINHGKEMLTRALLTADEEFKLAQDYKLGTHIEAQFKVLAEQLGRVVTAEDVAQSVEMSAAQVREKLDNMEHAKETLTAANMRLVFHIARYYKFRGVAYPDLVQEGTFGLIKAIQKFDPDRGFRFSTYASWWIKQAVSRAVAEKSRLIRMPVHIHDMVVSISKVEREFAMEHSRKPSPNEVALRLGLPLAKVEMLMRTAQDISSIDESAFQNRGKAEVSTTAVKERIASDSIEPAALSSANNLRVELRKAMSILNEREAQVLELRFGLTGNLPMTLEEIGKLYNVTRERIRQIEARALSKMRHPGKNSDLESSLNEQSSVAGCGDTREFNESSAITERSMNCNLGRNVRKADSVPGKSLAFQAPFPQGI